MTIDFYKYQGAGNDFVIIDNRSLLFPRDTELIRRICDRKFGVGADGLMLLENSKKADFKMVYFNADGHQGSMCGNGGRCLVAFANRKQLFDQKAVFEAQGDLYHAKLNGGLVSLEMQDVMTIEKHDSHLFLNTGSPHHICFVDDVAEFDVYSKGKVIRNSLPYGQEGTNVNFVQQLNDDSFKIRTYERGVENETLSCGTGATAVALAAHYSNKTDQNKLLIKTVGGDLTIDFRKETDHYSNIVLSGPATFVFKGSISNSI